MSVDLDQKIRRDRRDEMPAMASATMVNRTHRVVRGRAIAMQARRKRNRGLLLPLGISAALLVAVVFAIWTVLDESEVTPTGLPDASQQIFVLLMWCVPISLAALAVVLFKRSGKNSGDYEGESGGWS